MRARLLDAARLLRERYGATRVVLFGSLAWGGLHRRSDVDLAVEGIEPSALDRAAADCEAVLGTAVDLVPMSRLPETLATRIAERGIVLP